ncbi:hypothetical protein F511_29211 [Dorcoceras hygrometricum]|uniref:Uncharacterized protein n=1 Tax=Dorcoceras hygrometricum TaxID=472368 RepID=A0A2Z7AY77_9LAMI|nr:hypothetical protein F511_29211 [Dorcoceras hygrometricum]
MSLDDILLTIPVDIPLPSTCMEVTKITMGKSVKIPGVTKWTWFLQSLPRIPADDKGKQILVEKDPVKGNPAKEHYSLICADIDLLVLNWGETESPQIAIQRKFYILLKYRTVLVWKFLDAWRANFVPGQGSSAVDIQVIELLSDLYLSFLEELAKEARAHSLIWNKPCCSKIFEGSPRDRGAVIARSNSNTRSKCWIRKMILVDGLWTVELCADKWVKIPRKIISTEVPRQRQYDDTLPTMSVFFKLLRKRWADVCVEVVGFCASPRLLPIGSTQFCRSLQLAEPVSSFAPSRSSVFALRVSQFCSVFIDLSLFNWLPSTDISEFLSSIALDRTILRSVQRSQDSFAVAPSVQLCLEQHQSSSSTSDSSSSLHFDQTDVDATVSSRPTISPDLSAVFADFQAALSEQIFASQSDISSRMHKLEQSLSELVDYIHRGSADKKGESGSRGLQKPANTQKEGSAVTPTFEQRVQMAQRRIVQTVLDAYANRALLEIQDAAERDRERRRKEANCRTLQEFVLSIYSGNSAVGVFVRIQQMSLSRSAAEAFFRDFSRCIVSADGYSDLNQQMMLTSRCSTKIAKRRHLNKLTRHRFCERNQQMEKRICISAGEFLQAFFQSKFLTTTMDKLSLGPYALDQVTSEFSLYGMKPYMKGKPTLLTTAHPSVAKGQLTLLTAAHPSTVTVRYLRHKSFKTKHFFL